MPRHRDRRVSFTYVDVRSDVPFDEAHSTAAGVRAMLDAQVAPMSRHVNVDLVSSCHVMPCHRVAPFDAMCHVM